MLTGIAAILKPIAPIRFSRVAGIVDNLGGFRVVVTDRPDFKAHLNAERKEELFEVPLFFVQQPIEWNLIPQVIGRATDYTNEQLAAKGRNIRV